MKAKVVVFPIRGRNWCFSRSMEPSSSTGSQSSIVPSTSTFKQLYNRMRSSPEESKVELTVDFASDKIDQGWSTLEKAPQGTISNRIHGLGLLMLSRVKPSEIFLKSISKEVDGADMIYPSGLNPRLVRRRLPHVAQQVLPGLSVVPFRVLFRAYSHWRASQGSQKLLQLVSDDASSTHQKSVDDPDQSSDDDSNDDHDSTSSPLVLQPSDELKSSEVEPLLLAAPAKATLGSTPPAAAKGLPEAPFPASAPFLLHASVRTPLYWYSTDTESDIKKSWLKRIRVIDTEIEVTYKGNQKIKEKEAIVHGFWEERKQIQKDLEVIGHSLQKASDLVKLSDDHWKEIAALETCIKKLAKVKNKNDELKKEKRERRDKLKDILRERGYVIPK